MTTEPNDLGVRETTMEQWIADLSNILWHIQKNRQDGRTGKWYTFKDILDLVSYELAKAKEAGREEEKKRWIKMLDKIAANDGDWSKFKKIRNELASLSQTKEEK